MEILHKIVNFDHRMFYLCASSSQNSQSLTCKAIKLISKTGDGYLQAFIPILLMIYTDNTNYLVFEMFVLLNFYERSAYFILKNSCKRKRPPDKLLSFKSIITASDKFSFPSGHTSSAFLLATSIILIFGLNYSWLYIWATAVGMSRVALGVHFPSDIFAGALLGTGLAVLTSNTIF